MNDKRRPQQWWICRKSRYYATISTYLSTPLYRNNGIGVCATRRKKYVCNSLLTKRAFNSELKHPVRFWHTPYNGKTQLRDCLCQPWLMRQHINFVACDRPLLLCSLGMQMHEEWCNHFVWASLDVELLRMRVFFRGNPFSSHNNNNNNNNNNKNNNNDNDMIMIMIMMMIIIIIIIMIITIMMMMMTMMMIMIMMMMIMIMIIIVMIMIIIIMKLINYTNT